MSETNGATIIDAEPITVDETVARIAALEKAVKAGTGRIADLEETVKTLAWLHAELAQDFNARVIKVVTALALMNDPAHQGTVLSTLISSM